MKMREENAALFAGEAVFTTGPDEVAELKRRALASDRHGFRLCMHRDNDQPVLEALVTATPAGTRPPHAHRDRYETHLILEGEVTAFFFNEHGILTRRIDLGPPGGDKPFCLSAGPGHWHMIAFRSEMVVYYEITAGPYVKPGMPDWAAWAPAPDDVAGIAELVQRLEAE